MLYTIFSSLRLILRQVKKNHSLSLDVTPKDVDAFDWLLMQANRLGKDMVFFFYVSSQSHKAGTQDLQGRYGMTRLTDEE